MVLEHVVPERWLERKAYYAFFLGAAYSIIGILLSKILFSADPALPAVAFTSLLLLPELYTIFSIEERQQSRERTVSLARFWKDNGDLFRVMLFLFLGILLVYSFAAMFLPAFAVNSLFREQMALRGDFAAAGFAAQQAPFFDILLNNFLVLIAVFIVALLAGDGALFLIVWNASVWGTIFGVTARNAGYVSSGEPLFVFFHILLIVLPHVLLEAAAYILAAMAGSLLSKAALREKVNGKRFVQVLHENAFILFLALCALVVGAYVESLVLTNSDSYSRIVQLSLT
jgi:uncharacterized membrane protein SpoIIM required for sporulation